MKSTPSALTRTSVAQSEESARALNHSGGWVTVASGGAPKSVVNIVGEFVAKPGEHRGSTGVAFRHCFRGDSHILARLHDAVRLD